ncbi:hypothetical protein BU198_14890 [Streptomyces sp. CBMA156]|nr:hypothetical protein [Streptomyces sp. CBMA156]
MPRRYETFGMVAAEALATATPVLAFDIPCLRELVTDRVGGRQRWGRRRRPARWRARSSPSAARGERDRAAPLVPGHSTEAS